MTRDTYERALKSAAQIAFLSFIAGCGAAPAEGAETQSDESANTASDALAGKSCGGNTPTTDKSCKDAIKAAYPNGDPDWFGQGTPRKPTSTTDAQLAKCCEQVYFKNGQQNIGTPDMRNSGCCTVLRNSHSTVLGLACTPWGPPMPVAMRRAARRNVA